MTPRRWLLTTVAAIAVLLVAGRVMADLYADYAWYNSLGATAVWSARLATVMISRLIGLLSAATFAFANLLTVRRSVVSLVLQRQVGNIQIGETVPPRLLTLAAAILSLVLGVGLSLAQANWTDTILARSGQHFGDADPYYGFDLSFYVFWLPFESALWEWSVLVVLTISTMVLTLYVLTDGLRLQGGRLVASAHVRRHMTALVGMSLLLLAWHFRLEMYRLLLAQGSSDAVFSSIDQRVGISGGIVLVIGALVAGVAVLWTGAAGQFRFGTYAVGGVFVLWVLVRQVAPILFSELSDPATEASGALDAERQHVATQAAFTSRAYATDQIPLVDSALIYPSLARAASGLQLWDPPALRRAIAPTRVPDTSSSWIGWRATPGGLVADVVVRGEDRDDQRVPWLVARVDASAADADGGPVDIADPATTTTDRRIGERGITPPLIFPGAQEYAVVADSLHRVAGIRLVQTGTRLALAWSLQNPGFVFGSIATQTPTLVMYRDVRDRLERLVPFFEQGSVITPIVVGDSLYWAIDLYSASAWYPLSQRVTIGGKTWSYFHHAATAIIEGGSGDVIIVPDASLDPIARTWVLRFPALFSRWNALPMAVQAALPAPIDGAHAQAIAYGRFGSRTDTDVPRHTPTIDASDSQLQTRDPVYMVPDGSAIAVSLPLLDPSDRVSGTLVVVGGRDRRTVWNPVPGASIRWPVVLDRLHALDSITTRRESQVAHGRVRAIPVHGGVAFVQPVFGWPGQSAPSLEYVVFVDGDSVSRTPSLRDLGSSAEGGEAGALTGAELRARINVLYDVMRASQQRGDWAAYGRAFDSLGRLLGRLHGR